MNHQAIGIVQKPFRLGGTDVLGHRKVILTSALPGRSMTRKEIETAILTLFRDRFEIEDPDPDANLREAYEFDSIDAIEMLREIELLLGTELSRAEKKRAMEIRTLNQILDYIMSLSAEAAGRTDK
jgi:acyl carrier protein